MQRKIYILFSFFLIASNIYSQTIKKVSFQQDGTEIVVNYTITDVEKSKSFKTELWVSLDGGKTFQGPLVAVKGDVGDITSEGKKQIIWDVLDEMPAFEGDVIFEIRASLNPEAQGEEKKDLPFENKFSENKDVTPTENLEKTQEKITIKPFTRNSLSYSASLYAPIGLTFTQYNNWGFYGSVRISPQYFNSTAYSIDEDGVISTDNNPYTYQLPGNYERITELNFMAGATKQVWKMIYAYAGLGYGLRNVFTEIVHYEYSTTEDISISYESSREYASDNRETKSTSSVVLELGVSAVFKNISCGVGISNFGLNGQIENTISPVISLGYVF